MRRAGKSGRKSQTDERATYAYLAELWFTVIDVEKVNAKIASGKFTMKDMLLKLVIDGNSKVLIAIFDKVFPDSAIGRQYGQYHRYEKVEEELTEEEKAELADLMDKVFDGADEEAEEEKEEDASVKLPMTLAKFLNLPK